MSIEAFADVLAAAKRGEEWAIATLYRALQPRLLGYLRVRERGAAEDIASETWLRAARDLGSFEGDESGFAAWMFTLARHRLSDWRRHAARRPVTVTAPEDMPEGGTVNDAASSALEHLDTDAALALIATLPSDQADVVLLRVVGGLGTEQVAKTLGKRPGTVRVIQHRALRGLATRLASTEEYATRRDVTR